MTSDSKLVSNVVIDKYKGLESLVDAGEGTGTMSMAISKSFAQLVCIVIDLPHVVDGLQGNESLKYVGGDMFEAFPPVVCGDRADPYVRKG